MQVSAAFQHPVTPAPPQTWLHSQVTRRACCTHQCACVQFECVTQAPDLLLLRQVVALASAKLKELESGSTGQRMGEAQVREAAFRVFAELSPPGSPEQSYFWKGGPPYPQNAPRFARNWYRVYATHTPCSIKWQAFSKVSDAFGVRSSVLRSVAYTVHTSVCVFCGSQVDFINKVRIHQGN